MLRLTALFLLIWSASAAASPVSGRVELNFNVTKTQHDCVPTGSFTPNPGDGNCGLYQNIDLSVTQRGLIVFDGLFEENTDGSFRIVSGKVNCLFGNRSCVIHGPSDPSRQFAPDEIRYRPINFSLNTFFAFDLQSNTGYHEWEDDDAPFFGVGRFEFTNVEVVEYLYDRDYPAPAPVPLPAPVLGLLTGLFGLISLRRRARP